MIDPRSLAGVLLREHDTPEQAHRYALRKSRVLGAMSNAVSLDYAQAAQMIARCYQLPNIPLAA